MKNQKRNVDSDMMCGIGHCKPAGLQCLARMGVFVGMYSMCGLMTSVLSMYMVSQVTTLEKQFGFNSEQSGWLLSCNDIGFLMATLIASYVARKVHIPRTLWLSTVFYGFSGLMCALAYFISKDAMQEQPVQIGGGNSSTSKMRMFKQAALCTNLSLNSSDCESGSASASRTMSVGVGMPSEYSRVAIGLIAAGMVLQGVAKAPRYPFLTAYIDDNGKKKNTPMYMGLIMGISIFGPAIAFAIGGVFSKIYVTLEDVSITPRHPAWIGAWWLGFLVFGAMAIVAAFPLLCFPRRMKPKPIKETTQKTYQSKAGGMRLHIIAFTKSLLRLVTNPIYMMLLISSVVGSFVLAGSISFSAKYIETQFFLPAWKANILLGVVTIVSASLGTMVGGCIVSKKKLSPLGCIKMALALTVFCLAVNALGFVFGCPNPDIVGKNIQLDTSVQNGNISCGGSCNCDTTQYFPVCGSDGRNYFSPCVAGCTEQEQVGRRQVFTDCGCIGVNATAKPGLCNTECIMLYPYLAMSVVSAFFGTMGIMPGFIISIRSVSDEDKAMSIGFSSLLSSMIGWLPGPVVYGKMVDAACVIWATSCSKTGACILYDTNTFRISKVSIDLVPKVVSLIMYTLILLKARTTTNWSVDNVQRDDSSNAKNTLVEMKDTHSLDATMETLKPLPVNGVQGHGEEEQEKENGID